MWTTHFYDLLCKLGSLGIAVGVIVSSIGAVPKNRSGFVIAGAFALATVSWWFLFRPLSSWLYARFTLQAKLSWTQARRASCLFSPVVNLVKWHPMAEVKTLPGAERVPAILELVDEVRAYYDARSMEWQRTPLYGRIFRYGLWVLIGAVVVGSLANVPPFSWVSGLQARLFGGSYYPVITVLIFSIPPALALAALERRMGVRSVDLEAQRLVDEAKRREE